MSGLDGCAVAESDPGRVEAVAGSLIDLDVAGDLAALFRLLGDPTRVRILFALLEAGELCVCDVAAVVETSETKVSQAMRLLRLRWMCQDLRRRRKLARRIQAHRTNDLW